MSSGGPQDIYSTIDPYETSHSLEAGKAVEHSVIDESPPKDHLAPLSEDSEAEDVVEDFHPFTSKGEKRGRLSRDDAESIVGGQSIYSCDSRRTNAHPVARNDEPTENQETAIAGVERDDLTDDYDTSHKVFSFSLPFGGLSSITKHIPKLGFLDSNSEDHDQEFIADVQNRLAKQQSISTVDDARYFSNQHHVDNVRFRAVKHTLSNTIDGVVPGFIKRDKPAWERIYSEISGNIVFLGGYRGSSLREVKTNRSVWVPLTAGLKLRKVNLLLGPSDEDEKNASKTIVPDGMLKNVGPVDISKKIIKKIKSNSKANVYDFGYDWRLSGDIISEELIQYLQKVKNQTGENCIVIGHSMGGIMAHGAIQKRPDLFRAMIYVGAPSECLNILGPIRFGDNVVLSEKILTFETNFMMRSSFNFLPFSGRVFCNLEKNVYYDLDYFDPETWVEYNLNPLVAKKRREREIRRTELSSSPIASPLSSPTMSPRSTFSDLRFDKPGSHFGISAFGNAFRKAKRKTSSSLSSFSSTQHSSVTSPQESSEEDDTEEEYSYTFSESYDYLKRTLARTKKYMTDLEWKEDLAEKYPPMAVVYGNRVPSVRGSNVRGPQDIKDGNYYEFFYGHGDGVIHQNWLLPERKGFKPYDPTTGKGEIVGKFSSACGHVDLMTDFKTMGEALAAVVEAEKEWRHKK